MYIYQSVNEFDKHMDRRDLGQISQRFLYYIIGQICWRSLDYEIGTTVHPSDQKRTLLGGTTKLLK